MNRKELLIITIGIFFTVIAWLVADIFHTSQQQKAHAEIQVPANVKYDIDPKLLQIIQNKTE
jgi:hypothetical protein